MVRNIVIPAVVLAVASAQTYKITELPGFECSAIGMVDIPTAAECETALKSLAGAASILNNGNNADFPAGCYVENKGTTPDWTTATFNAGAGFPLSEDFYKVCRYSPPVTPPPVTKAPSLTVPEVTQVPATIKVTQPVTVPMGAVTQVPATIKVTQPVTVPMVTVTQVPATIKVTQPVTVPMVPVTQVPATVKVTQAPATVKVTQAPPLPATVPMVTVTQAPATVEETQAPAMVKVTLAPTESPTACPVQKGKLAAGPVEGMTCAEKFDKMFAEPTWPMESSDPDAKLRQSKCEPIYANLVASAPACAAAPARLFSTARGPVDTGAGGFNVVVAGLAALVAVALAASIAGLSRKRRAPRPDELEILVAEAREVA